MAGHTRELTPDIRLDEDTKYRVVTDIGLIGLVLSFEIAVWLTTTM